jgi:hypothetical protein
VVDVVLVDVDVRVELAEVELEVEVSVSGGDVACPVSSPLSPPHPHNRPTHHQTRIFAPFMTGQVTGPQNPSESLTV